MNNTNTQTQSQKHGYATLGSIQGHIKAIHQLAFECSTGEITKAGILNRILEKAEHALAEIDDLKRQIEVLAIHHETKAEREYLALPVVDLKGGLTQ